MLLPNFLIRIASYYNNNKSLFGYEGRFLLIFWVHSNLIVSKIGIQKAQQFMPSSGMYELIVMVQGKEFLGLTLFKSV